MIFNSTRSPAVYRLRPGKFEDSYGDVVEDWKRPERVRLLRAIVQEPTTEETDTGKRLVTGERSLYAPYKLDLTEDDRIEVEGEIWRVAGVPKVRRGFAMGVYTSATLTRAEGREE